MLRRFIDSGIEIPYFLNRCNTLHNWIRARLDLCGGWSQDLDAQYAPRCYGYYAFSPEASVTIRQVADQLWRLYSRLGNELASIVADGIPIDWPLDTFSPCERALLHRFRSPSTWATTLRADVCIDASGVPKIVEVNTDNVGGLEDLLMMLGFFGAAEPDLALRSSLNAALSKLSASYVHWLSVHYQSFRAHSENAPAELRDTTIAIVAEDRENSSALTRVLAAHLRAQGLDARSCRPENLERTADGLAIVDELGTTRKQVHVVLRDLLWHEMFEEDRQGESAAVLDKFRDLLDSAQEHKVLFLNPLSERFLFSKALLAELCTGKHKLFQLTDEERAFVDRHVAETDFFEDRDWVLKPASAYGGHGVLIFDSQVNALRHMPWVRQRRVNGEQITTLYRATIGDEPSLREMFVVHGLIIYGSPQGSGDLAGIMTRVGPDPVVNFSRGAQIVPGLLTDNTNA